MDEEKIRGEVASVNDSGVKIGDAWYNFSKFRQVQRPEEGAVVEITVKDNKWIQTLTVIRMVQNGPDKQTKISRSGLLNTAVALLKTQNRPITVAEVVEAARDFEPYLNEPIDNGEEPGDIPF
ncbi:MAG: hypothetical protein WBD99_02485 [Thermodesulfobacteriota bacterium]